MSYKRNQLEEAVSAVVEPLAKQRPSPGLRVRIKRLLEADRGLEFKPRAADPLLSRFAFFSEDSPGKGVEVRFSEYEVFAVCVALQLFAHGWTPAVVASIMRRAREELEAQHARILRAYRSGEAVKFVLPDTPFLIVVTETAADGTEKPHACSVRDSYLDAVKWMGQSEGSNRGYAMFHLYKYASLINQKLQQTEPRSRGQQG